MLNIYILKKSDIFENITIFSNPDIVTVVMSRTLISLRCFSAELFIRCKSWNADDDVEHGDTAAEDDSATDTSH